MYKNLTQLCLCFLLTIQFAFGQERTITGIVLDQKTKTPIAGATIRIDGTTTATATDEAGAFTLEIPSAEASFSISALGYVSAVQKVTAQDSKLTISLAAESERIDDVVVTAFGIQRKAKSLSYSTQTVKGEELTKVKDANPMNNLTGKVSGMQINRSSSGIGGSVNIILRGFKSNRNTQPLYVIDGLPITNTGGSGSEGPFGGGADRGDILSTLNADDILSINVLKGASASALYGSQGANGAIMITTKKGAEGNLKIDISSGITADQAFYLPKFQYRYGQTAEGS
ncbi:MAG: carboxypeptidase-like regulatory domain-containing protein, partial [Sphingobacterium sp.]